MRLQLTIYDLKQAIRAKYAWPGGYEMAGVTSDGALLCCDCMRVEFKQVVWSILNNCSDGWKIEGITHSGEMEGHSQCDHCSHVITEEE